MRVLTKAEGDLASRHFDYALRLSRRFAERFPSLQEEIEEAAMMGLMEAATKFDASRNTSFTTLAYVRIIGAIRDVIRSTLKQQKREREALEEISRRGVVFDTPSPEVGEGAVSILDGFPPSVRPLILKRFVESKSFSQIASEEGLPKATCVSRIHSALRHARVSLAG